MLYTGTLLLYCIVQSKHTGQLDELREAGHSSLGIIVEEYKSSMACCVQQQLEVCQTKFTQTMQQEAEKLRNLLAKQVNDNIEKEYLYM